VYRCHGACVQLASIQLASSCCIAIGAPNMPSCCIASCIAIHTRYRRYRMYIHTGQASLPQRLVVYCMQPGAVRSASGGPRLSPGPTASRCGAAKGTGGGWAGGVRGSLSFVQLWGVRTNKTRTRKRHVRSDYGDGYGHMVSVCLSVCAVSGSRKSKYKKV
jgi:hypothetical protein